MNIFFFFLILLSANQAFSAFNEKLVLTKVSEDGQSFVFFRKDGPAPMNGIVIKDPLTKSILYEAKVNRCGTKVCAATITKNNSGLKIRMDEEYVHSYNELPPEAETKESPPPEETPEVKKVVATPPPPPPPKPEPEPEPKPVPKPEPKPEPKPRPAPRVTPVVETPSKLDRAIFFSYGSPLGPGLKLGYFKQVEDSWVGVNYTNLSSTTSSVMLKGHLLSGTGTHSLVKLAPNLGVNILGELGLVKATLDFTGVDPDGPMKDEMTYFLSAAGEGKLTLDRFSFVVRSGITKSGLPQTYNGQINQYSNPYGTLLVYLELGAYYRF
jgi:hypothetical protein